MALMLKRKKAKLKIQSAQVMVTISNHHQNHEREEIVSNICHTPDKKKNKKKQKKAIVERQ